MSFRASSGAPWLAPFPRLARLARHRPNLRRFRARTGLRRFPSSFPARNEAANIETAVRSILSSAHDAFELLVVDDRSTDETAAIIEGLTAEDSPGDAWSAARPCRRDGLESPGPAFRLSRPHGDILLFTDADTRHAPELLGRAIATHCGGSAPIW